MFDSKKPTFGKLGPNTMKALLFSLLITYFAAAFGSVSPFFFEELDLYNPQSYLELLRQGLLPILLGGIWIFIPVLLISALVVPFVYKILVPHFKVTVLNSILVAGSFSTIVFGTIILFFGSDFNSLLLFFGFGAMTGFFFHRFDQGKWWS